MRHSALTSLRTELQKEIETESWVVLYRGSEKHLPGLKQLLAFAS